MTISDKARNILEWVLCVVIAFVLAILIKYYVGTPTIVSQVSMYPTLQSDQRLILNRWMRTIGQKPERYEIVTFEAPSKKGYVDATEINFKNPVAIYDNEPKNWISKFVYYVLEMGKESYIKRVIALPGERVKISQGKVYINDIELEEPYLQNGTITEALHNNYFMELTVPEDSVFVMGDNRNQSTDSRAFGCIPIEKIESKVWIRFWPFSLFGKV